MSVVWHDLECGGYTEDLALWRALAGEHEGPVLEVGAGTGRVALDLARNGHRVTALDRDPDLLSELARRADGVELDTILADARDFECAGRFSLCLMPMQTVQLLGGPGGRAAFLSCALRHLERGGLLAVALSDELEPYDVHDGALAPLPDIAEIDGVVYSSRPTAVRSDGDGFVLVRQRERITAAGRRSVCEDSIHLDRLTAGQLENEARAVGMTPVGRAAIPASRDYVGSSVVMLGG